MQHDVDFNDFVGSNDSAVGASHVANWLKGLGLEPYAQAFREHEIDAEILCNLTADDLKDIGVIPLTLQFLCRRISGPCAYPNLPLITLDGRVETSLGPPEEIFEGLTKHATCANQACV